MNGLRERDQIKDHYRGDATAEVYEASRFENELHKLLHEKQLSAVQQIIDTEQPRRTLEVAPGPGRLTRHVKTSNLLVCLEYNSGMIRQGRDRTPERVAWVQGDGFRLPFSSPFDLVYSFRFIRHFTKSDRSLLYGEIHRLLAPEGLFVFDAVNAQISEPLRQANPEQYPVYDELYKLEDLSAELQDAGFREFRVQPVQNRFHWQSASQCLVGPRSRWLNRRIIRALEFLPGGEPLEWVVTCRRA